MKKLMTTIAAATAAFGLYAADPVEALHGTSMEAADNYVVGEGVFGEDVWDGYWATDGEADESVVTAYGEETAPGHLNYDWFEGADQLNYLKVEAEQPLYRAIETATGMKTENLIPVDIAIDGERDGIIIDQLVKFSAFDAETEKIDVEAGAKIAVWVKADEEDDTTGTLQITTAKLDEYMDVLEENIRTIDTGIEVAVADWHQLKITTIKAADLDGDVVPGFTIQIDDTLLDCATDLFPAEPEAGDEIYTAEAKELIAVGKLFPSMVAVGSTSDAGTLVGVAYKGTGAIDDVAVANYVAEVPPAPTYDITATPPVNGRYTVKVDDKDVEAAEAGAEVKITAEADESYELDAITVVGADGTPVAVGEDGVFTMPAQAVTVTVTFKEVASEPDPTVIDPEDPSLVGKKATDVFTKISTDFANVDAKKFAQWCQKEGNDVGEFGKDAMLDAFLLDCLNTDAAIDEAKKDFVIESIEYDALTEEWIVLVKDEDAETTAYKNGYVQIIDAEELKDAAEEGVAEFFRAKLVAEPAE